MISFSCLESTEAVIFPVTCYHPGTIISQSAGIPCADPGYPHPFPVCLMFTTLLDISFSPQVQFLLFLSRYLPLHLQILEHDHICMVFFRISYNRTCNLFAQFCIQTFRICSSSLCLRRTMFPLESADPSQCTVHPVFFTGMIDKFSSQDSSVCPHDGTDCIGIDP